MTAKLGIATNILKTLETSSSVGMFVRDTGGCLISRLGLSRSKDESREISIAEISESALFYFSAPALAKGSANAFAKHFKVDKDTFTSNIKDLQNLNKKTLKNVKLGKFGQIMTVFGAILPAVFAIAPVRNNVTLAETGKKKFVSVVGLENKEENKKQRSEGIKKSVKLAKKLGLAAGITIGTSIGIIALSKKNEGIYKTFEPVIDKTIKHFDFTKSGDLEMKHYGALIYPVSIASYFYASRDKYERQENARRFSVTVPLMFFGEKLIQNPIYKACDKVFKTNNINKNGIKTYKELLKLPEKQKVQALKSKNLAYGSTFFINTMAIAAGVALLNRIETKKKYEREQNQVASYKISNRKMDSNPIFKDFMLK